MGAGAQYLRDFASDELAGPGLFHLVADSDFAACFEQLGEIRLGRMVGDAAHGALAPFGQGDVEDLGGDHGIFKEHFVEIPQPEQQQSIPGQLGFDSPVLRHHRGHFDRLATLAHPENQCTRSRKKIKKPGIPSKNRPAGSLHHRY